MRKKLLLSGCIVLAAALVIPLVNLFGKPTGTALGSRNTSDPDLAHVAKVFEGNCSHCHVPGTPAPFYASLPGASALIARDVKLGLSGMDLLDELFPGEGLRVSEPALAKIEREIALGSMPPNIYLVAHWNSGLKRADKEAVHKWIAKTRADYHAWPGTPDSLRSSLIPPIPQSLAVDVKKAELGKRLYHDKRLSGDDTVSCATCHDLEKGGTDQEKVSVGVRGQKGGINAPTTFNAAFQFVQFWDGRASTLQDQAGGPPNNPIEMDSNWQQIIGKLAADKTFAEEFRLSYPDGINETNITDAIANFERTLLTPNCRFDKFLSGDTKALSADEEQGWIRFRDMGCATCHSGVLMGGASFEKMGRHADYFTARGTQLTDADKGRYNASKSAKDMHRFKVPTLRNIAVTYPYFHDGSTSDLKEAVRIMAKCQCGNEPGSDDIALITSFLESLSGEFQGKQL